MRSSKTMLGRVSKLVVVAGLCAMAPVFAKDPAASEIKTNSKGTAVRGQAAAEPAAIPEYLTKLTLSAEQQADIKEIIHTSDAALGKVWKQFSDRYIQMIGLESSMLASIEDNLTEAQRQKVRDHRQKTAQHEKVIASTPGKLNQAPDKAATPVEEELGEVGVTMTAEQGAMADKIQEKFHDQLHSMHRDIQGFHARLLCLEADKLVRMEKVLTKEQLTELRKSRENAPVAQKLAADVEPAKSE